MERHRRVGVVLDVVGHVPGEEAHERVGVGRARVLEHVGRAGAAGVLGEQVRAQEELADHHWHDPQPQRREGAGRDRGRDDDRIRGQIAARLDNDAAPLLGRNPARGDAAEHAVHEEQAQAVAPVRQAGHVPEQTEPALGQRHRQLGVPLGILCVAVVIPVEDAVVAERQRNCEASGVTEQVVVHPGMEGRLVRRLVLRVEQEGEHVTQQDR